MAPLELAFRTNRFADPGPLGEVLEVGTQRRGDSNFIDFSGGLPNNNFYKPDGLIGREVGNILDKIGNHQQLLLDALQYGGSAGYPPLITAIKNHLGHDHNLDVDPRNIQVVVGSQEGLFVLGQVTCNPGEVILSDYPTYPGLISAVNLLDGVNLWGVATDNQGPIAEAVTRAIDYAVESGRRVGALYVPDSGNPRAQQILTKERLQELIETTEEKQIAIIHDAAYDGLVDEDVLKGNQCELAPPVTELTAERGFYLRTFSKSFAPGLRVGFVVVPGSARDAVRGYVFGSHLMPPGLTQVMLTEYITSGKMADNLPQIRAQYDRTRRAMVTALKQHPGHIEYQEPRAGMFIFSRNKLGVPALVAAPIIGRTKGVLTLPGEACYPKIGIEIPLEDELWRKFSFRLNHANTSEERIVEGINRFVEGLIEFANW